MKNLFNIPIPENRNFGLDLMRFIAILMVLISHSITVLPPAYYLVHKFIFDGVMMFFVLSGFLIGRILIRDFEASINIKKIIYFWKRRWFRTLPAYYFTILVILFLSFILGLHPNKLGIIRSLFFVQNLYYHSGVFFTESWSLSIEEWFYLTLPIVIFIINKVMNITIKKNIIITFIVVLLFSLIIRSFIHYTTIINTVSEWDTNIRSTVLTRLDSLLMGVLGAWFFIFKKDFFRKNKKILFIIGLFIFILNKLYTNIYLDTFSGFYINVLYLLVIPFSILLMIPIFYYISYPVNNYMKKMVTIGSLISYSMYLVNLTIVSAIILQPLDINIWLKFLLFWFLTIFSSVLIYKFIETPFMKLRDKQIE